MSEAEREIAATRLFDAPRELVWSVWTSLDHIGQWWGPIGFTTTIHEMDVRPGGEWRFIMHGPDGTDYDNEIVYLEVMRPERLVYDHGPVPRFRVTVTMAGEGGKTRLSMRSVFETGEVRDQVVRDRRAIDGMNQTLDRLGEHLAAVGA